MITICRRAITRYEDEVVTEYRAGHPSQRIRNEIYDKYRDEDALIHEFVIERRRTLPSGAVTEWEYMYSGEAEVFIGGDDEYMNAESLHPIHAWGVRTARRNDEIRKELSRITILKERWRHEWQEKANQALRDRRLFKKWSEGKLPQEKLDAIWRPIRVAALAEKETIIAEEEALREELRHLNDNPPSTEDIV